MHRNTEGFSFTVCSCASTYACTRAHTHTPTPPPTSPPSPLQTAVTVDFTAWSGGSCIQEALFGVMWNNCIWKRTLREWLDPEGAPLFKMGIGPGELRASFIAEVLLPKCSSRFPCAHHPEPSHCHLMPGLIQKPPHWPLYFHPCSLPPSSEFSSEFSNQHSERWFKTENMLHP